MLSALKELDRVLRGEATSVAALSQGTIPIRLFRLTFMIVVLALFYGLCMGSFAVLRFNELPTDDLYCLPVGGAMFCVPKQLVATMVKVPLLFLLTLIVTFPSLYVFNALVGSRLTIQPVLKLLIAALGVNLAVLASFGTIVAFFSICTTNYPFMILLNVVVFGLAGLLGLVFLLQTLHRFAVAAPDVSATPVSPERASYEASSGAGSPEGERPDESQIVTPQIVSQREPGALDRLEGHVLGRQVTTIFRVWLLIFGLVGAQMGWVLRPFVGDPHLPFSWFRQRESNFFLAIFESIQQLFGA